MDNSLKTKEKTPKRGADAPAKGKTKTFLIGKELKQKTYAIPRRNGQADPATTQTKRPDSLRREASQAAGAASYAALRPCGWTAPRYWGALSLSAMMARARWVRSSFSLGVNRMSPLTHG